MPEARSLIRLSSRIKYRREEFGAVALNLERQQTRFYNVAAAELIEQFVTPTLVQEILGGISDPGARKLVQRFVSDLLAKGIIETCTDRRESNAKIFPPNLRRATYDPVAAPLGIELELTLKCSRRCKYCAYEALPTFSTEGELATNEWRTVLHAMQRSGVFFVRFTGGDPLLRDDFRELLAIADDLDFVITVGSDLTHLDDSTIDALAHTRNLYALQTTLDGSTADLADTLRGANNFDHVVVGIQRLKGAAVPVIMGTVLTKQNVHDVYNIAKLAHELNVDGYCVAPLYEAGRARAKSVRGLVPDNDDLAVAAEHFSNAVRHKLVQPADPAWLGATEGMEAEEIRGLWRDQPFLMRAPNQLVRIDPRGRVYSSIKLKPHLQDEVYIGDVRSGDLSEFWNSSPLLERLRECSKSDSYFGDVIDVRRFSEEETHYA